MKKRIIILFLMLLFGSAFLFLNFDNTNNHKTYFTSSRYNVQQDKYITIKEAQKLVEERFEKYDVKHFDVLTGFKYIADIIKQKEGKKKWIQFYCIH